MDNYHKIAKMKSFVLITIAIFTSTSLYSQSWVNSNSFSGSGQLGPIEIAESDDNVSYVLGYFAKDIFAEGSTFQSRGSFDYFFASYNPDKQLKWFHTIGGTGYEFPDGKVLINDEDIYVIGSFNSKCYFSEGLDSIESNGNLDVFLAKYDINGNYKWSKVIVTGIERQFALSSDIHNDTIYISGIFDDSLIFNQQSYEKIVLPGKNHGFTGMFDTEGKLLDSYLIKALSQGSVRIVDLVVDDKFIYQSIIYEDSIVNDADTLISLGDFDVVFNKIRKNEAFEIEYRRVMGDFDERSLSIETSESGELFFSGYFTSPNLEIDISPTETDIFNGINFGGEDMFLGKFDNDFLLVDFIYFGGIGNDRLSGISILDDKLAITGYFSDKLIIEDDTLISTGTINKDFFLAIYDTNLEYQNSNSVPTTGNFTDIGIDIGFANNGDPVAIGFFNSEIFNLEDSVYINLNPGNSQFFITQYGCLNINIQSQDFQIPRCYNESSASISLQGSGGFSNLLYSINNGQTFQSSSEFTNLPAGEYQVMVKDSAGCEQMGSLLVVGQPDSLYIFSIDSVDVSLNGENDGRIMVMGSGGTTPYTWTLNDGPPIQSGDFFGLTAGKYQVALVDANDCGPVLSDSITIREPGVGIEDFYAGKIALYPNPVHSSLTIRLKDTVPGEILILITDASGRGVLSKNFTSTGGELSRNIEVSDLDRGLYFVRIAGGETLGSFVKE